jgi:hypothetical protein
LGVALAAAEGASRVALAVVEGASGAALAVVEDGWGVVVVALPAHDERGDSEKSSVILLQASIELWYATTAWPIALTLSVLITGQASAALTVINEVELLVLDEEFENVADDWLEIEVLGDVVDDWLEIEVLGDVDGVSSGVKLGVGLGLSGLGVVGAPGPVVGWGVAMPSVPIWTGGWSGGGGNMKPGGGNGGTGTGMMTFSGVEHVKQGQIGRIVGVFWPGSVVVVWEIVERPLIESVVLEIRKEAEVCVIVEGNEVSEAPVTSGASKEEEVKFDDGVGVGGGWLVDRVIATKEDSNEEGMEVTTSVLFCWLSAEVDSVFAVWLIREDGSDELTKSGLSLIPRLLDLMAIEIVCWEHKASKNAKHASALDWKGMVKMESSDGGLGDGHIGLGARIYIKGTSCCRPKFQMATWVAEVGVVPG